MNISDLKTLGFLVVVAGSDLKCLNVKDCKAYLRKHGLRLSGTKAVCIERIVEHWRYLTLSINTKYTLSLFLPSYFVFRIKDGSGKAVYPRSSFAINCKGTNAVFGFAIFENFSRVLTVSDIGAGDVCKGDTVLFTQKVHHK